MHMHCHSLTGIDAKGIRCLSANDNSIFTESAYLDNSLKLGQLQPIFFNVAWLQMHVQQPFLAPWGNSKLLAARCGVRGTTHVEKSGPAQLFFTWHDSTRLKNAVHLPKMPAPGPTLAGWGGWGLLVAR